MAPLGAEVRATRLLGSTLSALLPNRKRLLRSHLHAALGRDATAAELRRCFATHFAHQHVGPLFAKLDTKSWPRLVHIEGWEHLDHALAIGNGVVVAHPHMGLPQLPLHVLGVEGYDVHQVAGGQPRATMTTGGRWASARRAELEQQLCATLHDGRAYLRPLLRVLARNGIVFTASDGTGNGQELGRRETHLVLGSHFLMPVLPAWLADHSGAIVVPMSCWFSQESPMLLARFEPHLSPPQITAQLATHLSHCLRAHPTGWHFWDQWVQGSLLTETT